MKKGENKNHPRKGSRIKVEPIRDVKDIRAIKKLLDGNPMYSALLTLGINTNLRASDLLRITAGKVRGLKAMDEIELKEKKTGKTRRITLNKAVSGGKILPKMAAMKDGFRGAFFRRGSQFLPVHPF